METPTDAAPMSCTTIRMESDLRAELDALADRWRPFGPSVKLRRSDVIRTALRRGVQSLAAELEATT